MGRNVGLWLDHSECIVAFPDEGEFLRRFTSHAGKRMQVRGAEAAHKQGTIDPILAKQLTSFYNDIIACVHSADAIYILGPDEAKTELHNRLTAANLGDRVLGVEKVEKMAAREIVAKIHSCFTKNAVAV